MHQSISKSLSVSVVGAFRGGGKFYGTALTSGCYIAGSLENYQILDIALGVACKDTESS